MKVTHQGVRDVLADGPLLSQDLAAFFPGSTHRDVGGVLSTMRTARRKQVYIKEWTVDVLGQKHQPRPVYALGDKPCAPRPKRRPNAEIVARYRAKRRVQVQAPASIFELARFL